MEFEFDPEKRRLTLLHRGLDMALAGDVFEGDTITIADDRKDYGEARYITIGYLNKRMVVLVWTTRGQRAISMWKANDRDKAAYGKKLG
jgi:uncharacterized protein